MPRYSGELCHLRRNRDVRLCRPCLDEGKPISWFELHPDGKRTMFTSSAALYGAAMLDHEGAPDLNQEQFEDLTKTLRAADVETGGSA